MSTTEDLLKQIEQMLDHMEAGDPPAVETSPPPHPPPPKRAAVAAIETTPAPTLVPEPEMQPEPRPEPEPEPTPAPSERRPAIDERRRSGRVWPRIARELRFLGILMLAFAVGAMGTLAYRAFQPRQQAETKGPATVAPAEQDVTIWNVWPSEQRDLVFVTVLASGGNRDPLAVVVPSYTAVSIPGQDLGTVQDAGGGRDAELVATTIGNVLQVPIDATVATDGRELQELVDAAGGVDGASGRLTGAQALGYLTEGGVDPTDRFIRWQEILTGLLEGLEEHPDLFAGMPAEARPTFDSLEPGTGMFELPVKDIGVGLADPDTEGIEALVKERFLTPGRTAGGIRLVILNGNGRPGIGADVALLLVPIGFRLVSSLNARRFDENVTHIVAATPEFLDEAKLARTVLGVGEVFLGEQPTNVADVSVVVGKDFLRR